MGPPEKFFLPMPDGFKQFFGHWRQRELIEESFPAIDGDKVDFPARIHPQRNIVRQMLLAGTIHEWESKTIPGNFAIKLFRQTIWRTVSRCGAICLRSRQCPNFNGGAPRAARRVGSQRDPTHQIRMPVVTGCG